MKSKILGLLAAALLAGPMAANAVTITALGGNDYRVTFDPLTFNVTTAGEVAAIVFEDFYATTSASCGINVSGSVQTSVNGGAVADLAGNECTGIYNSLNDVDGNDLLVTIVVSFRNTFGLASVGDLVTTASADYVFRVSGLNAAANTGPFTAFLVNNNFERISDFQSTSTAVPEPGTLALLGLGLLGLGLTRRKAA